MRELDIDDLKLEHFGFAKGSHKTFKERYEAYLQSSAWQHRREQVIARACGVCERCGLKCVHGCGCAVHHLTYKRVFRERLSDLVYYCQDCHKLAHDISEYDRLER